MSISIEITPNIQTVIWDLDGTLLDSFGIYKDCLNKVLRDHGRLEAPEWILRNNHHGHIEESIVNVLKDMKQTLSLDEKNKIMRDFYALDNGYIKDVDYHLFEDAVDLVKRAHKAGKYQIVVTNRPHGSNRGNGSPRNLVANSRLREVMSDIICGDDSEYRKPYRELLEVQYGSDLTSLGGIMVIGDQFVDAEFAQNIGCRAILIARTDKIVHLERVDSWEDHVDIVPSLRSVKV
jgi:phosphoglycolate phosphatase-like HAD superfamily hydrolase